jgi:TetR/AcrR family transcriptional repressor of mexJK operon
MGESVVVDRRIARSRVAILAGAATIFLRDGYDRASVDDIAREAGVAKRTVYNVFADKEALFRDTVGVAIGIAEKFSAETAAATGAIREVADIVPMSRRLASAVLRGPVLPLRRLLVSETRRFPDLAAEYRRRAPETVLAALAGALRDLASAGELRIEDPDLAAEHLAFLIMGADMDRGMFGDEPPSEARTRRRAEAGAAAFIRAYATP